MNIMLRKKKINQSNLFISIGGGINQIPLIEEAKKLGLQTIGVDRDICAAGMHKCDIRIQESIENYIEISQKLKELMVDGDITGVLTKSFGPAIKTASYIAGELKIPFLSFNRIDDFINKERMKGIFKASGINSPDFEIYNKDNPRNKQIKTAFPFVIKPVIGHAKNEVELIWDLKDFHKYSNTILSKKSDYIIEEYIKGDEIIAVGIVHEGKFHLVEMTDKIKSPPPYFVDIMHIAPSKYTHLWEKIQDIGQKVSESFGVVTSPLIMELIVSENSEIYLIETAPEFGGEFISDILIPERTKYNIISESIRAITNRNFSPPVNKKFRNAVVVKYFTGSKGILLSFKPLKNKFPKVIFSRIFKDIGSAIRKPVTNHDRIGVIITKAKTIQEAMQAAETAQTELNIRIE